MCSAGSRVDPIKILWRIRPHAPQKDKVLWRTSPTCTQISVKHIFRCVT
jgi:hypothetical protein